MINAKKIINDKQVTFEIKGHAEYAIHGRDIVCASVSTAVILVENLIDNLNLSYNITELKVDEGYFKLVFNQENEILEGIAKTLDGMLIQLCEVYPKYIKYNR